MVGHTHEDIDGLFGVLSRKLCNAHAYTRQEMDHLFNEAQRSASGPQSRLSRSGVGIDNHFFPTDAYDSRLTASVADFRALFEVRYASWTWYPNVRCVARACWHFFGSRRES